ncbi:MAG: DUF5723 family protein [Bacteroidales bacterium]|nr:DUF5723 family protein [Bacteroidales bacterium]MCF8405994.1 DUF5723 family protein [Bacteroidales bacterium]
MDHLRVHKYIWAVVLLLMVLCLPVKLSSQVSRSVYFLQHLPESNIVNPSFHPDKKFYINLPIISSFYIGFESPFSFKQLTEKWEEGDSLYIDREAVMGTLNEKNYFSFELYNELGRIGFGAGRHYFHASIAKVFSTKFSFEKELFALLLYGNADERFFGKRAQLDRSGLNMSSYHEFSLGYSYKINNKLAAGTRLKYLNGSFNIWTEKAEFMLFTDNQPNFAITASSDIILRTSSTISDFDNMIDQIEGYKWFDLSGNHGLSIDLGLKYNPQPNYELSASVVDIGKIKWQENVKNYVSANPGKEFTFTGFDINDFINEGQFTDSISFLDTLSSHFKLDKNYEAYTSHLNPKVYIGGLWRLNSSNELGVLLRTDIAERRIQPSFTINYTHRFGNWMALYGNYSIISRNFANIGFGLSLKMGPVQFYVLNDMAYAIIKPAEARNYNLHFGMNFIFGKLKNPTDKQGPDPSNTE